MNVWPLIHRELLVGARRRSTQWTRVAVALVAIFIGLIYLPLVVVDAGLPTGRVLFSLLISMAFVVAGLFGVFFAADVISSERREGTLGLLFLTRLRGMDVVLGKLFSSSLRAAFAMLAAAPVMALPLMLGGVTFEDYWHAALVLANTLFLSASVGILISAFNRNPVRPVLITLFVLMAMTGGTLLMDLGLVWYTGERQFVPRLGFASPARALYEGVDGSTARMLASLGVQHALAWLCLWGAACKTGRHSDEERSESRRGRVRWLGSRKESNSARQLREKRPVSWLVSYRSRGPTVVALVVFGLAVVMLAGAASLYTMNELWATILSTVIALVAGVYGFILTIWLAVDASRRTGDSRSGGALELLLTTPLSDAEIISGFWQGIVRAFRLPIIVLVLLQIVALVIQVVSLVGMLSGQMGASGPVAVQVGFGSPQGILLSQVLGGGLGIVNTLLQYSAIVWVGLWLGLRFERTMGAAAMTFVLVAIVPTFVISIVSVIFFGIMAAAGWMAMWFPTVIATLVAWGINVGFIVWARRQLMTSFRTAASGTLSSRRVRNRTPRRSTPPPLPA